jgi:hypothetical protein
MKQRNPRAWGLVGCGVLILYFFLVELAWSMRYFDAGKADWVVWLNVLGNFGPPLTLGIILVVAGLFGRKWQARWQDRHRTG